MSFFKRLFRASTSEDTREAMNEIKQVQEQKTVKALVIGNGSNDFLQKINNQKLGIGIDFENVEINNYKFRIWSAAGQERFRSVSSAYLKNTEIVFIMADGIDSLYQNRCYCENHSDIVPKMVVVLNDQNMSVLAYAKEHQLPLIRVSTKTTNNELQQVIADIYEGSYKSNYEVSTEASAPRIDEEEIIGFDSTASPIDARDGEFIYADENTKYRF